jgi:hypothetical protein
MKNTALSHDEIKKRLEWLIVKASSEDTFTGFARVLETLGHVAETSDSPLIKASAPGLAAALESATMSGSFLAPGVHDDLTPDQLTCIVNKSLGAEVDRVIKSGPALRLEDM